MRFFFFFFLLCFSSCSSIEEAQKKQIKERNKRKDVVHRFSYEKHYPEEKLSFKEKEPYPWEAGYTGGRPPITKESFRCKGKHNHSLPLKEGKEFVYPVLLDLLNYVQAKTGCPVHITSGHRCPEHHKLVDSSSYNAESKHMIGAEVDFYVVGMETSPLEVVHQIMSYYREKEPYKENKEYAVFLQLDPSRLNVSTPPWYNKEILVKLYLPNEGRNGENAHGFPYLSIQVRFDLEKNERVLYSKEKTQVRY